VTDGVYFSSPEEFRAWLEEHHQAQTEVWVGYWKKATGKPSLERDQHRQGRAAARRGPHAAGRRGRVRPPARRPIGDLRERRLGTLIEDSAAGRRLAQMSNARKKE
jgi:hypothetical protein